MCDVTKILFRFNVIRRTYYASIFVYFISMADNMGWGRFPLKQNPSAQHLKIDMIYLRNHNFIKYII